MRILLTVMIALSFVGCASSSSWRNPSSKLDLSGTYLGSAKYPMGRKGANRPAVRLYLNEIEGESGSYHAILLEYVDLTKMAPQYIASSAAPVLNNFIGYLKSITRKVSMYKVVQKDNNTYEMFRLKVEGDRIVASSFNNSFLVLSDKATAENPLAGAKITTSRSGEEAPATFASPGDGERDRLGIQFGMANLVYSKAKLKSTWREKYLTGDYLAAYAKKDDKVLELSNRGGAMKADFMINPKNGYRQVRKRHSRKKTEVTTVLDKTQSRKNIFTNEKSAFITGSFDVINPEKKMFIFKSKKGQKYNDKEFVENRIGVFVDIFDATEALGQDVVELIMVNTDDPEDFLMYYEHPDNGEGE